MKTIVAAACLLVLCSTSASLRAQNASLSFTFRADKKLLDADRSHTDRDRESQEKWAYRVTIENRNFQEVSDIEARYVIYGSQEIPGMTRGKAPETNLAGSTKIGTIAKAGKFEFNTEEIDFRKRELAAGWHYTNGAKTRTRGTLDGIWLRLYKDGKMIAEYALPSNLTSKHRWPSPVAQ